MRPIILLAALLILLLPVSTTGTIHRISTVTTSPTQSDQPGTPWSVSSGATSVGQNIILKSVFGIAFFNSSGKITIQPASLFMNMTLKMTNSTGSLFTINTANITIGPSPTVTPRLLFILAYPGSGQAFFSASGHLTIHAQMAEIFPCQLLNPPCMIPSLIYTLFLTGPARLASTSITTTVFTRLFGFLTSTSLSPSPSKIGLFFIVGIAPGDLDEDGRVDILDVAVIASCFDTDTIQLSMAAPTTTTTEYSYCLYADSNGDGRVDILDVALLAANFGQTF